MQSKCSSSTCSLISSDFSSLDSKNEDTAKASIIERRPSQKPHNVDFDYFHHTIMKIYMKWMKGTSLAFTITSQTMRLKLGERKFCLCSKVALTLRASSQWWNLHSWIWYLAVCWNIKFVIMIKYYVVWTFSECIIILRLQSK